MADTEALNYANSIMQKAESLSYDIANEYQTLEQARSLAENTLHQLDMISGKVTQSTDTLNNAQQQASELINENMHLSNEFNTLHSHFADKADTTKSLSALRVEKTFELAPCPTLPDLAVSTDIKTQNISSVSHTQNQEIWDELAAEFTTFSEDINNALQQIELANQDTAEVLDQNENHQPAKAANTHNTALKTEKNNRP